MKDVIKFAVFLAQRIEQDYPGAMGSIVRKKLLELTAEYVGPELIGELEKNWGA